MCKRLYVSFFIIVLFLGSWESVAQIPEVDWVKTFGGSEYEILWETRVDHQGNIINVGLFHDTVDFDPGPGLDIKIAPVDVSNMFVQKLDHEGNLIWVKTLSSPKLVTSLLLTILSDNSMVISGVFSHDSLDFDPSPNSSYYVEGIPSLNSPYILKLDSHGNFVWAGVHTGQSIAISSMVSDSFDNIYTVGFFRQPFDANPDPSVYDTITPHTPGKSDFYIQKLNSDGQQLWIRSIKGSEDLLSNGITLNHNQEPVVVGSLKGTADFDPGTGVANVSAGGSNFSGFVLQLTPEGVYKRVTLIEATSNSFCKIADVKTDGANNIYLAGSYKGSNVDFDPRPAVQRPSADQGWFIEKLDSNGALDWSHAYRCDLSGEQYRAVDLVVDDQRNVYVEGYFDDGDLELEPGKPDGIILGHKSARDMFLAKHNSTGELTWAHGFGSNGNDRILSMDRTAEGLIYISGYYSGNINFNPYDPAKVTLNRRRYDCFILKFKSCPILPAQITLDTASAVFAWDYSEALPGSYNFSWYNCDGDSLIPGEADTTFSPTQNGNYALIIEGEGCIDTSDCFSVQNVSVQENNFLHGIEVFPNPTENILYIKGIRGRTVHLSVVDIMGRKMMEAYDQDYLDLGKVKSGTYLVLINIDGLITVKKVVRN